MRFSNNIAALILIATLATAAQAQEKTTGQVVAPDVNQLEQSVKAETARQESLAKRWDARIKLTEDQRFDLAVKCLCTMASGVSVYDSKVGKRITAEARTYLVDNIKTTLPRIIETLPKHAKRDERGMTFQLNNLVDILGCTQSREAIVPLVKCLLEFDGDYPGNGYLLCQAIGKIGDEDTVPSLIKAYPYQRPSSQDLIAIVVGQCGTKEHVPTLIEWSTGSTTGCPCLMAVYALAQHCDQRAKPLFRKILSNKRASNAHRQAVYGLVFLGVNDLEFDSIVVDSNLRDTYDAMRRQRPSPIRYEVQHRGPNDELRAMVEKHIAARKKERETTVTELGLELELRPSKKSFRIGEEVGFEMLISNKSDHSRKVMRSRDASDCGWVCPKLTIEMWGPDHRLVQPGIGRCGNVNALTPEDIHALAPGKSFNVIGKGSFGHYMLNTRTFTVPGKYQLRAIYDTKTPGSGGLGDRGHRPMDVAPVRLVTKTIELEVLPTDE